MDSTRCWKYYSEVRIEMIASHSFSTFDDVNLKSLKCCTGFSRFGANVRHVLMIKISLFTPTIFFLLKVTVIALYSNTCLLFTLLSESNFYRELQSTHLVVSTSVSLHWQHKTMFWSVVGNLFVC